MRPDCGSSEDSAQRAMATLCGVLREIGWDEIAEVQGSSVFVDLRGDDPPVAYLHVAICERLEYFVVYVVLRVVPPIGARGACASHIARINHDILAGGFDLDFDSGRLSFKTGAGFAGDELRAPQVRSAILAALEAVETYGNEIAEVAADAPAGNVPIAISRPDPFAPATGAAWRASTTMGRRARVASPERDP